MQLKQAFIPTWHAAFVKVMSGILHSGKVMCRKVIFYDLKQIFLVYLKWKTEKQSSPTNILKVFNLLSCSDFLGNVSFQFRLSLLPCFCLNKPHIQTIAVFAEMSKKSFFFSFKQFFVRICKLQTPLENPQLVMNNVVWGNNGAELLWCWHIWAAN